jgi:homoserine dehydrogenase
VDAHDVVAKARILAGAAFGQTIQLDQVIRCSIRGLAKGVVEQAVRNGCRLKLVAIVRPHQSDGPTSMPLDVR